MFKKIFQKTRKTRTSILLAGLPDYLKDSRNYNKIQRALLDTLAGMHSHTEMEQWDQCLTCKNKYTEHKEMLLRLGFKNVAQYFAWKKIMDVMTGKSKPKPLPMPIEPPTAEEIAQVQKHINTIQ